MEFGSGGAQFRGFVRDIADFVGPRLWRLLFLSVMASAAEGAGLMLLVPILGYLGIAGSGGWDPPVSLGLALAGYVLLVGGAALVVARRGTAVAALRLAYMDHLRQRIHGALLQMEWRAFSRLRGSDAINVLAVEIVRTANGLDYLFRLLGWALEIAVLLAVAFHLSALLTVFCLVLAVAGMVLGRPLSRRIHDLGGQQAAANRAVMADIADDLTGMRLIHGLGLAAERRQRLGRRLDDLRRGQLEFLRSMARNRAFNQIAAAGAGALAVWFSVQVLAVALADTLVLMAAFARLASAVLRVQDGWRTVLNTVPAHAAAKAFLTRCQAQVDAAVGEQQAAVPVLADAISLDAVGFRYGPHGPGALSQVCARIPAGSITAVAGPSGAGKSTLADLLSGLTEPDHGTVRVDGVALTGGLRREWRRHVGYVPQDCFLFHDTIRANLLLAAPAAPEAELWAALEAAAAADFVRALPNGLDSMAGDRGCRLSGGQRQRLTLARALLGKPRLLILDEATGALDAENEARILDALAALRGNLTIVIITHRPSTIHLADQVLTLEDGRLVQ